MSSKIIYIYLSIYLFIYESRMIVDPRANLLLLYPVYTLGNKESSVGGGERQAGEGGVIFEGEEREAKEKNREYEMWWRGELKGDGLGGGGGRGWRGGAG